MREARADDGARYWVVDGSKEYEVAVDNMMKTFEEFAHDVKESEHEYPYAPPTDIRGESFAMFSSNQVITPCI